MSDIESIAFSAMSSDLLRLQIAAQNMANMNTPGYRSQHVLLNGVSPFQSSLLGAFHQARPAVGVSGEAANLQATGVQQDAAILGDGYFRVHDGEQFLLTRRGQFELNHLGQLSIGGLAVLTDSGVVSPSTSQFRVTDSAQVVDSDGHPLGRLELFRPGPDAKIDYLGRGVYQVSGALERLDESQISLRPGYLDGSNVSPAQQMIATTESVRHFGLAKDVLAANDQMIAAVSDAVRSMGR